MPPPRPAPRDASQPPAAGAGPTRAVSNCPGSGGSTTRSTTSGSSRPTDAGRPGTASRRNARLGGEAMAAGPHAGRGAHRRPRRRRDRVVEHVEVAVTAGLGTRGSGLDRASARLRAGHEQRRGAGFGRPEQRCSIAVSLMTASRAERAAARARPRRRAGRLSAGPARTPSPTSPACASATSPSSRATASAPASRRSCRTAATSSRTRCRRRVRRQRLRQARGLDAGRRARHDRNADPAHQHAERGRRGGRRRPLDARAARQRRRALGQRAGRRNQRRRAERHPRPARHAEHVLAAIAAAREGPVDEGVGRRGHGHAVLRLEGRHRHVVARSSPAGAARYTLGVLVQTNFGGVLTIDGVPVGKLLRPLRLRTVSVRARAARIRPTARA